MSNQTVDICTLELDVKSGDSINLMGDIHSGLNSRYERDIFKSHVKHLSHRKNRHVFLGGDLLDVHQYATVPEAKGTRANIFSEIETFLDDTKPIHKQIRGIVWGNHEDRLFRNPSGKGSMPNILYGHIGLSNEIARSNPELVVAELQKSLHVKLNVKNGDPLTLIVKHGHRAGKHSMIGEHDEIIRLYSSVDIVSLHHTHSPYWFPTCDVDVDGKLHPINIFRGSAYVGWTPYGDKKNLPPALMGYWEIKITKDKINPVFKRG